MPRDAQTLIFVGIRDAVVALDAGSGAEVWAAGLSGSDYVTVLWDGECLLAANNGEVWRLDPATGSTLWHNELKGYGRGLVSLATSRAPASGGSEAAAERIRRARQAAATAAT